jgi:hypothetical protein
MQCEVIRLKCNLIVSLEDEVVLRYSIEHKITFNQAFKKLCRIAAINEFIKQYDSRTKQ